VHVHIYFCSHVRVAYALVLVYTIKRELSVLILSSCDLLAVHLSAPPSRSLLHIQTLDLMSNLKNCGSNRKMTHYLHELHLVWSSLDRLFSPIVVPIPRPKSCNSSPAIDVCVLTKSQTPASPVQSHTPPHTKATGTHRHQCPPPPSVRCLRLVRPLPRL
jgi:hypothetical protein